MAPNTVLVSCSSVLICNNIQVPRYKALLVLPYFIPIATAVKQDELNSALRCNPRVYHVDSIFTEWVPVCALWEVHQNLRPEGPSNGALLKGLTWRADAQKRKEMLLQYCTSTEWSVAFIAAETEFIVGWRTEAEQRTSQNDSSFDLWKAWAERPCLEKKKRAGLQQRGKNPSSGYVTQLITIKMDW